MGRVVIDATIIDDDGERWLGLSQADGAQKPVFEAEKWNPLRLRDSPGAASIFPTPPAQRRCQPCRSGEIDWFDGLAQEFSQCRELAETVVEHTIAIHKEQSFVRGLHVTHQPQHSTLTPTSTFLRCCGLATYDYADRLRTSPNAIRDPAPVFRCEMNFMTSSKRWAHECCLTAYSA